MGAALALGCQSDAKKLARLELEETEAKYLYLATQQRLDSIAVITPITDQERASVDSGTRFWRAQADSAKTRWTLAQRDLERFLHQ